jgi:hypothetical protein
VDVVSRIDFSTAPVVQGMSPKKRPANRTIKGIAFRLAWWANANGSSLFPSLGLISVVCEVDYDTAKTVMRVLRSLDLLHLLRHGGSRGSRESESNRYLLTLPEDLLSRVRVLSPDEVKARVQAMASSRSRGGMHPPADPGQAVDNPVAGSEQGGDAPPKTARSAVDNPVAGSEQGGDAPPKTAQSRGGMHPPADGAGGGCPVEQGGDAPPLPTKDQPPTTPTKTSPQVSTSPASSTANREQLDRPPPVPPAARPPGPGTQTRLWPCAVPDLPPEHVRRIQEGIASCRAATETARSRPTA